jgi:superfamily I DNA/RNA helicase
MAPTITKVYGPPGTGKTTWQLAKLQEELGGGLDVNRIAYLTHTKAAAEVVGDRIGGDAKDRLWFRTIHSACVKKLGISKENIVDPVDYRAFSKHTGMKIVNEREDALIEDGMYYAADNFGPVLRAYDLHRLTGDPMQEIVAKMPQHPSLMRGRRAKFLEEWEKYKEANGLFDFTDMLMRYVDSDLDPLPVDAVFLDEAQDLSKLQWRVFHKFFANAQRVYIAGDDDQAIYGFMGGSEFGFFEEPADETIVLRNSWRVPGDIGRRAERIIERVKQRQIKDVIWKDSDGHVAHVGLGLMNLPWRGWLDAGKTVLVLTRHRRGALDASGELHQIAIPHGVGGWSAHNSAQAKVIRDFILLREGEKLGWRRVLKMFEATKQEVLADAIRSKGLEQRDLEVDRTQLKFTQFDDPEWSLLFAHERGDLKRIKTLERLIDREGIHIVGQEPQINVMTMHAAKGREADIVVLLPDCNETVRSNLMLPSEIRLAYVALTRAKERALILTPQTAKWITHLVQA